MLFWKKRRYAAVLLGISGLVFLWAARGSGAPDPPGGGHRTAVFYVT
jgi:hypothetical protein